MDHWHRCHWSHMFILKFFFHFTNIKPFNVQLPNGHHITAHTFGTVILSLRLVLSDTLYLPSFSFNIISVTKLISQLQCHLTFSQASCLIQDSRALRTIGVAEVQAGFYILKSPSFPSPSVSFNSSVFSISPANKDSSVFWHYRLGHPSPYKLEQLHVQNPFTINKENICDVCHFAKQKKLPFSLSISKSSHAFELTHASIRGPLFTASIHRHHYFLSIVDDYSRHTWLYLMKNKSKAPSLIQSFFALIKN